MGLLDLLKAFAESGNNSRDINRDLNIETAKDLGMTNSEIKDMLDSGISPEEWLEENEPENYHDQGLLQFSQGIDK